MAEVAAAMRRAGPRLAGASVGRMRAAVSSSSSASDWLLALFSEKAPWGSVVVEDGSVLLLTEAELVFPFLLALEDVSFKPEAKARFGAEAGLILFELFVLLVPLESVALLLTVRKAALLIV